VSLPRLLDLGCGGGGGALGYARAGFDVTGVDIVAQYEYPFAFVLGDMLTYELDGFDAIHASPPCKLWTGARGDRHVARLFEPHVDTLSPMLARLAEVEVPWIVENVPGAPMPDGSIVLCGSSFGLDVRRHRLFASNVKLTAPPCDHAAQEAGRFRSLDWSRHTAGKRDAVVGVHGSLQYAGELEVRRRAMGIDWLSNERLTQAIPPAYTEHLGRQLRALTG
jgi:DNA (cytosine-5)-methyltransferase 1